MTLGVLPHVPESLQPYASGGFFEVTDRFAAMSVDEITRAMPELQIYNRYKEQEPAVNAVLYRPRDFDPTHAVVIPYPFGNGHGPNMHIRNRVTQAVLGNNVQVIGIPNNTPDVTVYHLNEKQRAEVAGGDASALAAAALGVASELRVQTLDILGYSQGAFVGAAIMKLAQKRGEVEVKHALLAEPTNILDRTPEQLRKAFMGTGLFPLIHAVRDSGIPALAKVQAMSGLIDSPRLARALLGAQKGSKLPSNAALHRGMTKANLLELLQDVEFRDSGSMQAKVTLARAINSKVTPASLDYEFISSFLAHQTITIEDYGHEAADNVTGVFSLLAKAALGGKS